MSCHPRRAASRLWMLALGLLFALPVVLGGNRDAEAGAPPVNDTYRDKVHKFSLKMFRDYKAVPLKTNEKTTVCKFRDPKSKGEMRGSFSIEIEVVKVSLDGKDEPVTTGDGKMPKSIEELMRRGSKPKSVWEATVGGLWLDDNGKKVAEKARKKFKAIKSKDKPAIPGKLWQFEVPMVQSWDNEKLHVTLAVFFQL